MRLKLLIKEPIGVSGVKEESKILARTALSLRPRPESILDMGCGTAYIAVYLAKKGFNADGADISKKAIEVSKRNAELNKVTIPFFLSNLFSNINKKYDLIIFNSPLVDSKGSHIMDALKSAIRKIEILRKFFRRFFFNSNIRKRLELNKRFVDQSINHLNANGRLLVLDYIDNVGMYQDIPDRFRIRKIKNDLLSKEGLLMLDISLRK